MPRCAKALWFEGPGARATLPPAVQSPQEEVLHTHGHPARSLRPLSHAQRFLMGPVIVRVQMGHLLQQSCPPDRSVKS